MKSFEAICPVYNEEKTIPLFFERLQGVFDVLRTKYDCRLTFIDNGSTDKSQELVKELCAKYEWVSHIVMSRNFGYQSSIECGVRNSNADYTGFVDVDCEDPPEMFIEFMKHIESGYDVAYGERLDRPEPWVVKMLRKIFYRVTRATADERFILDMAEFSLMSRMVRDAICRDNNSFPFIRASIGRVGFDIKNVPYTRHKRIAGETHYNMRGMVIFAVAGILSSSTLWLRIPVYLFPIWFLISILGLVAFALTENELYYKLVATTGLMFIAFTLTGISLYLARVYKNGLGRPNYIVNVKKSTVRGRPVT
ncbi:MAG: glycosyltransferase family 2 protein [Bdellovibrionota bacterium]